jgi:hypothetical protein
MPQTYPGAQLEELLPAEVFFSFLPDEEDFEEEPESEDPDCPEDEPESDDPPEEESEPEEAEESPEEDLASAAACLALLAERVP